MISISNLSVSTSAAVGTTIGTLTTYNASGTAIKANYVLTKNSAGYFAISGSNLVTAGAPVPVGNYSVRVHANGTNTSLSGNAHFVVTVTSP
jgi:hypothetical protein